MPYIKKEHRLPVFDTAINNVLIERISRSEFGEILAMEIDSLNTNSNLDGIVNYVLTKLLLHPKVNSSFDHILRMAFYRTYLEIFEGDGYRGHERWIGLLHCMLLEFKRRKWAGWKTSFLKRQLDLYEKVINEYEAAKMKENGDVI